MPADAFDIYQTPTGVTAVTNPVQRQILAALAEEDRQLPELVELTGKAKPTLSGIHMKELLNRELIVERPHPKDSRRKIYRLQARPLGSSGVPVEELRSAVQHYARHSLTAAGVPLQAAFHVLAAAPADAPEAVMRAQAQELGRISAKGIDGDGARDFAAALSQFVEKEGLAEHLQIDFEALSFRCRPGPGAQGIDAGRMGVLLAAFAEGAAQEKGIADILFTSSSEDGVFRLGLA